LNLEHLTTQLAAQINGRERLTLEIPGFRHAAVLVAITLEANPKLILTVRSSELPTHKGQISFPGGKLEAGESVQAGALREAYEEISLEPNAARIIGLLDDVWTPARFTATPVVALLEPEAQLMRNPGEVAEILYVPISDLRNLQPRFEQRNVPPDVFEKIPERSKRGEVLHYDWRSDAGIQYDIWGMTAFVIQHLLELSHP
jgi:8-oxo-dGTP pyrophosphatase MutT (NUDIX family)